MNFHKFFNFHAVLRQFLKISGIFNHSGNFVALQPHVRVRQLSPKFLKRERCVRPSKFTESLNISSRSLILTNKDTVGDRLNG